MRIRIRSVHWIALILCYIAATFFVSTLPGSSFSHWKLQLRYDLILHVIEYGILAWMLLRYLDAKEKLLPWGRTILSVTFCCAAIGGLNELLQATIAGRYASLDDEAANIIGALVVIMIYRQRKLSETRT